MRSVCVWCTVGGISSEVFVEDASRESTAPSPPASTFASASPCPERPSPLSAESLTCSDDDDCDVV